MRYNLSDYGAILARAQANNTKLPLFTVLESNPNVPLGKDKAENKKECKELHKQ